MTAEPNTDARLDGRRARLVRLFAAIVAFDAEELTALRAAAPDGEPDAGWREAFLMAHLFAGIPRTLAALEVVARAGGLGAPLASELAPERGVEAGDELFARIYGESASAVHAAIEQVHPVLAAWVREHAYGRVLARPGLDAATRELCAVAALAITGHERQLASHARGAVRCGATPDDVAAALALAERWVPESFRETARQVVARFAR